MALTDIYKFFQTLEDEHIILSFKGDFTPGLLNAFLHLMEAKMNELNIETQKRKRVVNVLIESLQNLYHHVDSGEKESFFKQKDTALVIIKYFKGVFTIQTGNFIDSSSISDLKTRLKEVNSLNLEELRGYYKEKLANDPRSKKGTAGLGLIDLARKSKNKLDYHFIHVDDKTSFFSLKVIVE